jgi:O-antigen ligase
MPKRIEPPRGKQPRPSNFMAAVGALVFLSGLLPLVIAYQIPPQPTFVNQWCAGVLWLAVAAVGAWYLSKTANDRSNFVATARWTERWRSPELWLVAFWVAMIFGVTLSVAAGRAPFFVQVPSLSVLALALALTFFLVSLDATARDRMVYVLLFALLFAALANAAVALLQFAAPLWHDDIWIAAGYGDRPYGNLRQPNHLALLSLWGLLALVALFSRRYRAIGLLLSLPLLAALWLSGSRAGWLALPIAAVFAAVHLRATRTSTTRLTASKRAVIALAIGALAFVVVTAAVVLVVRASEGGVREIAILQRVSLWRDVLSLIAESPWLGIGFNQLNFAWTLMPLPARSGDVFDHAHNLPLQFAAEFGIPGAALLLLSLSIALTLAIAKSTASWRWVGVGIVAVSLWQSLFEYPLWFAHLLLPVVAIAALLANTATATTKPQSTIAPSASNIALRRTGVATAFGLAAAFAVWLVQGYRDVSRIYANANDLEKATAAAASAQTHYVYGHYGDYAAIMLKQDRATLELFVRPTRNIIDEKLLTAWARALDRAGRFEDAAYIVARAREFKPDPAFENLPPVVSQSSPHRSRVAAFRRAPSDKK